MRSASTARSRIDPEALRALVTVAAFLRAAGYNVPNVGRRMACVLHDGGNPTSFSFTDTVYRCHTCGAGGDVFALAMALYRLTFPEALARVAQVAGIGVEGLPALDQAEIERRHTISRRRAALARWRSGRHGEWLCVIYDLEIEAEKLAPYYLDRGRDGENPDGEGWRLLASLYSDLQLATLQAARLADPDEAAWAEAWLDEQDGRTPLPAELKV